MSAQAQAMAKMIAALAAEHVIEILEAKQSRQKPGKHSPGRPVQLEFGGEA